MKILIFLQLFVIFTSFLHAASSIIGSYSLGFSYSYQKGDNYSASGPSLNSNFAIHPNISLGAGLGYRSTDIDSFNYISQGVPLTNKSEQDGIVGSLGFTFHNRFEASDSLDIDPFLSLSLAAAWVNVDGSITNQFGFSAPYSLSFNTKLYSLGLGTEFVINDFFIFTPYLSFSDYIDDDGTGADSSVAWSLSGSFLFTEYFSSGIRLGGGDDYTVIGLGSYIHY